MESVFAHFCILFNYSLKYLSLDSGLDPESRLHLNIWLNGCLVKSFFLDSRLHGNDNIPLLGKNLVKNKSQCKDTTEMNDKKFLVVPSILSADFRTLEAEIKAVEEAGADWIHCDIMDGRFVPNISFGPMVVDTAKKCTDLPLDVHLMIVHPEEYIKNFAEAGADYITVHAEACQDLQAVISLIKENGSKAGVTVNPDKSVDLIMPFIDQLDLVLIMSVYAGFSGQKFIHDVMSKLQQVRNEISHNKYSCRLEIDGGINEDTAKISAEYGADVFVAGSFIYGGERYKERIEAVRNGAVMGWKE